MISLVIPVYNEEENIPLLHKRITEACDQWDDSYEVILVDDGSSDQTLPMSREIVKADPRFKVIKLSRNFGHQAAISAGIKASKGDAVILLDGDLQDPPEVLIRFIEKWREGFHVVYGIRTKRKESLFKRMTYSLFYRILARMSDIEIPLDSGDFCLMDRQVVQVLTEQMPERIRFIRGLRAYSGFNQVGLTYERDSRAAGEAKYTYRKLIKLALDGLFDFSVVPLRLASLIGFIVSAASFLVGIFFIVHRIIDFKIFGYSPADIPGLASLAVGLFFLSGLMLLILGIIGEYLGRIYFEVKKRPFYIVEETIEGSTD